MQSAAVTTQKKQTHCECGDPLGIATADQRNSKLMQQGVPQLCMKCLGRVVSPSRVPLVFFRSAAETQAQEGSAFTQASPAVRQHLENQHALFDQALSGRRPSNVSWLAPNVSPATGSPLRISFDSSPSSQLSRARNYYGGVAHLYLDPSAFMSNGLTAQARPCVLLK